MDPTIMRTIERLVIVTGGIVFAYLGYRLYINGVEKAWLLQMPNYHLRKSHWLEVVQGWVSCLWEASCCW
jgi:hypothetical protein